MAYDQGHYQPPQRPYNGRAAQRPGPPQGYNQGPPPQQQYAPQQQYDQYPQDAYGYNDYDNGYAQDYNDGYGDVNGGRGNGYPQQDRNYPPPQQQQQQDYYGDPREGGMPPPRGRGGPPPQQRGPPMDGGMGGGYDQRGPPPQQRGGGPPPRQRPPPLDDRGFDPRGGSGQRGGRPGPGSQRPPPLNDMRGDYDQRAPPQGYQNGPPAGRGGGPPPQERSYSTEPGQQPQQVRRPLKTPPISPNQQAWDNPFPTFPGAKKKTSVDEEKNILQKMEKMSVNGSPPDNRPRTAGSRSGQGGYGAPSRAATFDDYGGRPSVDSQRQPGPQGEYGRSSLDNQRRPGPGPANDFQRPPERQRPPPQDAYVQEPQQAFSQPQQAFPQPQRPPHPRAVGGTTTARNNAYWDPGFENGESFAPPSRSNTMPVEQPPPMMNQAPQQRPMDGPGPSAPYNGPVGRNMPPRPSTATGVRAPPQRQYTDPAPAPLQHQPAPLQQNSAPQQNFQDSYDDRDTNHRQNESISEFYDSYYDDPDPRYRNSGQSDMPNFDALSNEPPAHRRGPSIDNHISNGPIHQQGGYQNQKPVQNQADYRALAQPQAAVFETASDGQRTPTNAHFQRDQYDDYGPPNDQYNQHSQSHGQFNQPPPNSNYNQGPPPTQRPTMQGNYSDPPKNAFQPPPRSTSAAPRMGQGPPFGNGPPPPAVGPKPMMNGQFGGPMQNGPMQNGPMQNGGMPRHNSAGSANSYQQSRPGEDPNHPTPVRPGLMPGSVAAQNANTKPAPVRNYNNNVGPGNPPAQQQPQQPQQSQQSQPAAPQQPAAPAAPQGLTMGELEMVRNAAKAKPNDAALQLLLVKKLVEASDVLVNSYPDVRMRNKMREKYVMDASKMLKRLVASNNTDAMFYLADCYGRGALGLESNDKEAFNLYQSAAKAGHAAAAYRTAVCCELGSEDGGGTRKDPVKAIQWYKRAAALGDTPAMYKLGMIQLKGLLGQPQSAKEAVQWLKRAAERADAENPHALHELGLLFEAPQTPDGSIVRDEVYALSLFKQAADLGYKFSQFRLGCAYEYGLLGCSIDPRQSIAWYSRAAVQEEHQSELALSGWYLTGSEGVLQQSDTEAYLWARKAAMAGLAKAEYAMGYFTEMGIGSPSSLEDAKRWYWRAAAQNFPKARERLEDLKKNGGKGSGKPRERISRSKVGKQNEGECAVM